MKRFQNKVVLVTGGNRNTGLSIVQKFAEEGAAKVYMCGSTPESTDKGAAILESWGCRNIRSIPCDVSDPVQVQHLFDVIEQESGRLDILVNNAAHQGIGKPFTEMPSAYLMEVLGVNVRGGFQVTQQAVNRFFLKQPERGVVVFLSSNTAMRAIRNRTAYCTSKGAINSLVRSLALDLGPRGIRVNACAPGYIYTERWDVLPDAVKQRRRLNCPLRHEASGRDIANVVAFLASSDSANITGEIITCDAGCSCQHMPEDVDF